MKKLFFRNDDVGWNLKDFDRLLSLFVTNHHKLNGAAIPSASLDSYPVGIFSEFKKNLQIHTHGFAHLDHQSEGKKAEFGSARSLDSVKKELQQAYANTQHIFGDLFFPAFTPPWNRIEDSWISLIHECGFRILSRDGDRKNSIAGLGDLNVHIDLHTSRKPVAYTPETLLQEVLSLQTPYNHVGIMIHHKHMAEADFVFIDQFLQLLTAKEIPTYFFSELESELESDLKKSPC